MSVSSDEESSGSSSNEYLVASDKIDLESSFFKGSTSKTQDLTSKYENEGSDDDSEDFDSVDDNKVDSAALLAQVMKNLEKANNQPCQDDPGTSEASKPESPKKDNKRGLSDEIAALLLRGESGPSAVETDQNEEEEDAEDARPAGYTIPQEGVNIVLPGSVVSFKRQKKGATSMEEMLRMRMNRTIRSNQIYVHKTGLLCWLAHGFHLNRAINDPEVLSTSLSLVPSAGYPKGRVDLKYLEQFTKWFKNLLKLEFRKVDESVRTETLLARLKDRKVHNYRELVLLYVATLRAIGLTCRLVVSLCPPPLKPGGDQLIQNPKSKSADEKPKEKSGKSVSKSAKETSKGSKKRNSDKSEGESSSIVPENSGQLEKSAKLDAKKRAADIFAKFAHVPNKKSIKTLIDRKPSEAIVKSQKTDDAKKSPDKNSSDSRSPEKVRSGVKSPKPELEKLKYSPLAKRLRSRLKENSLQSIKPQVTKSITFEKETTKVEAKSSRRTRSTKPIVPSTSEKAESDSDREIDPPRKKKRTLTKNVKPEAYSDSDQDFEVKPPPKRRKTINAKKEVKAERSSRHSIDRRVLSSEEESAEVVDAKGAQNIWVEVYVESEESWISVSVPDDKIHCVSEIYKKAPKPVLYVVAWNSVGTIKDVTRRYCPHWLTVTRKQRVDENWWSETLYPWKEKDTVLSKAEDEMLLQRELEQPLPKTVSECKGHPLYVLTRHLLKFEALYPPECAPLGHLHTGDAIYSRHCVHTLCSRETWIKKARVVKPAQEAYKIVKAMPKYDKLSGMKLKDQPLELFGKWQTNPYVPPEAKNGVVPRNEYGNVDLFQECMLPKGTVHINLPGLNRVARKLNIDCSPAVVGFNFGTRGALPAFEGFVVCEEYEDTLREAWESEQIEARKRAKEKREKRIYDNWKKLIKGLLIRERLAARYDFSNEGDHDPDTKKASSSTKNSKRKVGKN